LFFNTGALMKVEELITQYEQYIEALSDSGSQVDKLRVRIFKGIIDDLSKVDTDSEIMSLDELEKLHDKQEPSVVDGFQQIRIIGTSGNKKNCAHCGDETYKVILFIKRIHRCCDKCEEACKRA